MDSSTFIFGVPPSPIYDGILEASFDEYFLPMFLRTPSPPPTQPLLLKSDLIPPRSKRSRLSPAHTYPRQFAKGISQSYPERISLSNEQRWPVPPEVVNGKQREQRHLPVIDMFSKDQAQQVETIEMLNLASKGEHASDSASASKCACGSRMVQRVVSAASDVGQKQHVTASGLRKISSSIFENHERSSAGFDPETTGLDIVSDHTVENQLLDRQIIVTAFDNQIENETSSIEDLWPRKLVSAIYSGAAENVSAGSNLEAMALPAPISGDSQEQQANDSRRPDELHIESDADKSSAFGTVKIRPVQDQAASQSPICLDTLLPDIFENAMVSPTPTETCKSCFAFLKRRKSARPINETPKGTMPLRRLKVHGKLYMKFDRGFSVLANLFKPRAAKTNI